MITHIKPQNPLALAPIAKPAPEAKPVKAPLRRLSAPLSPEAQARRDAANARAKIAYQAAFAAALKDGLRTVEARDEALDAAWEARQN